MKWQSLALNAGRFQSKTQAHNDIINNSLVDLRYKGERKKHPKLENMVKNIKANQMYGAL